MWLRHACGVRRLTFFQQQKKVSERGTTDRFSGQFKNAALKRRGAKHSASGVQLAASQASSIASVVLLHVWPSQWECHKDVRCETDLRAVRDGFGRWLIVQ